MVSRKIIATAIARGYVVDGGYTFERVRIVNGEGYYNFYATNAQAACLKERMIQRSRYTYLR